MVHGIVQEVVYIVYSKTVCGTVETTLMRERDKGTKVTQNTEEMMNIAQIWLNISNWIEMRSDPSFGDFPKKSKGVQI